MDVIILVIAMLRKYFDADLLRDTGRHRRSACFSKINSLEGFMIGFVVKSLPWSLWPSQS